MGGIIFLGVMLLLLWVVIVLPQQRRVRAHRALVAQIEIGDEVMTTSGMFGTIVDVQPEDDLVLVEVAPGLQLRFVRGAIARRVVEETPEPIEEDDSAIEIESLEDEPPADVIETDDLQDKS
jgi:preprotein translocase subunit YajC